MASRPLPWDKVRAALKGAGQAALQAASPAAFAPAAMQTGIGLAEGYASGKSPKRKGSAFVFDAPPGSTPRASGQAVFMPQDADPVTAAHEMRHADQAAWMPGAAALGTIGDLAIPRMTGIPGSNLYLNPLEVDAYASQPAGQQTSDDLATIKSMAEKSPMLAKLLGAYLRR